LQLALDEFMNLLITSPDVGIITARMADASIYGAIFFPAFKLADDKQHTYSRQVSLTPSSV